MKVKVEIVTGFLGAGKTALINELISQTYVEDENILVIQLENGKTNILNRTHDKFKLNIININEDITIVKDELIKAINTYKPNRIFIENNGTESVEALIDVLWTSPLKKLTTLKCIYYIADGKTLRSYLLNMGELLHPSIALSNLLIINNSAVISDMELEVNKKNLEAINFNGFILCSKNNSDLKRTLSDSKLIDKSLTTKMCIKLKKKLNK